MLFFFLYRLVGHQVAEDRLVLHSQLLDKLIRYLQSIYDMLPKTFKSVLLHRL